MNTSAVFINFYFLDNYLKYLKEFKFFYLHRIVKQVIMFRWRKEEKIGEDLITYQINQVLKSFLLISKKYFAATVEHCKQRSFNFQ